MSYYEDRYKSKLLMSYIVRKLQRNSAHAKVLKLHVHNKIKTKTIFLTLRVIVWYSFINRVYDCFRETRRGTNFEWFFAPRFKALWKFVIRSIFWWAKHKCLTLELQNVRRTCSQFPTTHLKIRLLIWKLLNVKRAEKGGPILEWHQNFSRTIFGDHSLHVQFKPNIKNPNRILGLVG
jgi:hypothetical protein